ncbi:MAG: HAMP domain-containing protein [Nitrospirae bacterium]|nr:HAMP domain-containing protein [Nitrospirota bacterium]
MKIPDYLRRNQESLGAKILYLFAGLIVIIYFLFAAFFIYHESKSEKLHLISSGRQLSSLLAHNAKLGVFTENADLLKDPVGGILQNREVMLVQVFTADGKVLKTQKSPYRETREKNVKGVFSMQERAIDTLSKSRSISYSIDENKIEFWAPVISNPSFNEEDLFFDGGPSSSEMKVTGFIRILLTTEFMKKNLRGIFLKSILIPVLLLIPALIVTYLLVRGVTKPLRRLTVEAKALGAGHPVDKVFVERRDEVGKLAEAFNNMADSLRKRDSEKQQLEDQLRQAQKMEAIGTLAGGIAHDFNNILGAMIGYIELLQQRGEDADFVRRGLEQLMSSAEKGETLVKSLLAYSKKQAIYPERVNLNVIAGSIEGILTRLLHEKIDLKIDLAEEDLNILADPVQIERVLMNLAANARDAMQGGGILAVRTRRVRCSEFRAWGREKFTAELQAKCSGSNTDFAEISVTDTGAGMDKQTKERIFDPFFTTKKAGAGTGLGLSIVYGIVRQHNGYIYVDSEPGKGTAFRIYLPLCANAEAEKQETGPETMDNAD